MHVCMSKEEIKINFANFFFLNAQIDIKKLHFVEMQNYNLHVIHLPLHLYLLHTEISNWQECIQLQQIHNIGMLSKCCTSILMNHSL